MGSRKVNFRAAMMAGVAASCLFGGAAAAAAADQPAAAANQLTEVVVTARKREENLQSVPLAVSVQTGAGLQQHQITDTYQLQRVTPSLKTQTTFGVPGQPQFVIRGIGTSVSGVNVENSVGLVVDDVPIARVQMANIQLFDIDNVQVLRGPQGMLFGKNASAGLINITTKTPDLNKTEYFGRLEYDNLNTPGSGSGGRVDLGTNLPIGQDAALRVVGFYTHGPALAKNVFKDQDLGMDMYGLRAKLRWDPTDAIKIVLSGDYAREHGIGEGVQTYRFVPPGGVGAALLAARGITAGPDNHLIAAEGPNDGVYEIYGTSLRADYSLDNGFTLTSVTGYRGNSSRFTTDQDGTPANFLSFQELSAGMWQVSQELRLTSPAGKRFTYQGGLFFQHATVRSTLLGLGNLGAPKALFPASQFFTGWTIPAEFNSQSKAVFFEGQYKILDSLRLTAGARYTHDNLTFFTQNNPFPTSIAASDRAGAYSLPINNAISKNNVSWRASLDYDLAENVMVYASYSLGYKGPAFNSAPAAPPVGGAKVGSEIPHDYELGVKSTLLDNRLRANLTLYDQTFDGFQTQIAGFPTSSTSNAGKLKSKGVEVEITAIPIEGLTISGGLTYNDTKYVGLTSITCYPGEPVGTGVNQCRPASALAPPPFNTPAYPFGVQDVSGNQLAGASKWVESISARYERPVADGWTGFAQADGYFRSPYYLGQSVDPYLRVGQSAIFGLSLGARRDDGNLGFTFFVRNIGDKAIPSLVIVPPLGPDGAAGDRSQQFGTDAFRTIGVSMDFRM